MEAFDELIKNTIQPNSIVSGTGAVVLSFFTGKLAPKLPEKFYKLLDNSLVRIILISYLLYQQIHMPSISVMIAAVLVIGTDLLIKFVAPDTPKLSELVKSTIKGDEKPNESAKPPTCNCFCNSTVTEEKDGRYSKVTPPHGEGRQQYPMFHPANV